MTNQVRAEQAAIAEIESAFAESGWSDGWGLNDAQVRQAPSPLFYRGSTLKTAADAKVIANGAGHTLYAIYSVMRPECKYADNQAHHYNVTIAITLYYDDPHLFAAGSGFDTYLEGLLSELGERLWAISGEDEGAVTGPSDRAPYVQRKVIYVTNTF